MQLNRAQPWEVSMPVTMPRLNTLLANSALVRTPRDLCCCFQTLNSVGGSHLFVAQARVQRNKRCHAGRQRPQPLLPRHPYQ